MQTSGRTSALLTLAVLLLLGQGSSAQTLEEQTFDHWRDTILPVEAELRWTRIPWLATFWEAVVQAQREEKPILLWAMNGHPLACT